MLFRSGSSAVEAAVTATTEQRVQIEANTQVCDMGPGRQGCPGKAGIPGNSVGMVQAELTVDLRVWGL